MAEVCAECGREFASSTALVEHVRNRHANDKPPLNSSGDPTDYKWHACALCGAKFRDPRELAEHNLRPHDIVTHEIMDPGPAR
jgi:DNA-directed RNA polymerase subunit RPC12/RpoP